jgi:hypothetical protein
VETTYFGIFVTGEKCRRGTEALRKEEKRLGKYLVTGMTVTLPSFMSLRTQLFLVILIAVM